MPMKKSISPNTSGSRQRCIGLCQRVRINNVTVPAICFSKHRCKAFPDIGNHGLAGCLKSSHKYQGWLLGLGRRPWCMKRQIFTSSDKAYCRWRPHWSPSPSPWRYMEGDIVWCRIISSYWWFVEAVYFLQWSVRYSEPHKVIMWSKLYMQLISWKKSYLIKLLLLMLMPQHTRSYWLL